MARKRTAPIPKSKAKNAFDLLSEIAALALEEPKRMRMGIWGGRASREDYANLRANQMPSCGTVGCIGGWTMTLKPRGRFATEILGLDFDQANDLMFANGLVDADGQGTAKHARMVAAHIRRFQTEHAKQLKAKRV